MSIASRPRSGTTYGRGETIVVQVGFNEPVTVTGAPELALTLGSVTRSAAFVRSAERSLWFRYRVGGDDRDADGIGIAAGCADPERRHHHRPYRQCRAARSRPPCHRGRRRTPGGWRAGGQRRARGRRRHADLGTAERQHLRVRRDDRDRGAVQRAGDRHRCAAATLEHRQRPARTRGTRLPASRSFASATWCRMETAARWAPPRGCPGSERRHHSRRGRQRRRAAPRQREPRLRRHGERRRTG